jgi:hypothetical protein
MHHPATSTSKRQRLVAVAALTTVMVAVIVLLALARKTGHRLVGSSETTSIDDLSASRLPPQARSPAPFTQRSRAMRFDPEEPMGAADGTPDASSVNRAPPDWLDAGPWGFDDLAAFWQKERVDPEWSANVKEYIYAMLEPEDLNLDVLNGVDCRQTLCRIEMNAAHMQAIARLRGTGGAGQPRFAHRFQKGDSDGAAVMVVYTARDDLVERVFPEAPSRDPGSD